MVCHRSVTPLPNSSLNSCLFLLIILTKLDSSSHFFYFFALFSRKKLSSPHPSNMDHFDIVKQINLTSKATPNDPHASIHKSNMAFSLVGMHPQSSHSGLLTNVPDLASLPREVYVDFYASYSSTYLWLPLSVFLMSILHVWGMLPLVWGGSCALSYSARS